MTGFELLQFPRALLQEGNELERWCFNPLQQLIMVVQDQVKRSEHSERAGGFPEQGQLSCLASQAGQQLSKGCRPTVLQSQGAPRAATDLKQESPTQAGMKSQQDEELRPHRRTEHFATRVLNNLRVSIRSQISPGSLAASL